MNIEWMTDSKLQYARPQFHAPPQRTFVTHTHTHNSKSLHMCVRDMIKSNTNFYNETILADTS